MDFFDQEAHAKSRTRRLLCLFGLAVFAFLVLTYLILAVPILFFCNPSAVDFSAWIWDPRLACWVAIVTLFSITLGCLYKLRLLSGGGAAVAELLGGRLVESNPADAGEKKLRDVVEEMAVASGLSVPAIYVLDHERGINAFAAGRTRDEVAIAVTFGALKLLDRDELQGIVAHEFSHVLNGDMRLNMRLMVLAHGLFWPTIVGRVLVRGTTRAPEIGESIFDEGTPPVFLPTALPGVLFLIIGGISSPLVRLLKSLICREREWLADAAAVQFTRNPAGIAGALRKIGGLYKQGRLDTPFAETASHLYFVNSACDPWLSCLSTHPPLAKRILAIDPAFDGQFPHIQSLKRPTEDLSQEAQYDRLYEETLRREREEAKQRGELE
ncbi:MAG TPA: M48 family metalloprotease [Candidatus Sulfopaludibacter sp.]|nr:M48 family metalloprotease [Candidatus Sulfopaludibacter sp.]